MGIALLYFIYIVTHFVVIKTSFQVNYFPSLRKNTLMRSARAFLLSTAEAADGFSRNVAG
jgi:hypothetical protein